MKLLQTPGTLRQFRRTAWKYQQTFATPLASLPPFVALIIKSLEPLRGGGLTLERVVFEPEHLIALLTSHGLPPQYGHHTTVSTDGPVETAALLEAVLHDWIDFLFIPDPRPFVIYADHDEFITFFAQTKSNLNRAVAPLLGAKFKVVEDYERQL